MEIELYAIFFPHIIQSSMSIFEEYFILFLEEQFILEQRAVLAILTVIG